MELKQPLVSILMPAYNAQKYISDAINSILRQTYPNWELLISDDASSDGTLEIIESFKDNRIKCFHNKDNLGYLKTWNNLIVKSEGDFISFLDADDYCSDNRIEIQLRFLLENPNIGAVGCNYSQIDSNNVKIFNSNFPTQHDIIFNGMPNKFHLIGSALMIRKIVYLEIGGYDLFFDRLGAEDYYWAYLIAEKYRIANLKDVLYFYRFNPNSVSVDISSSPSKLNIHKILSHLIEQRKLNGTDDLQNNSRDELLKKLDQLNKPFVNNKSFLYYYVAKRRFYEGHREIAIKLMFLAIGYSPLKLKYYRDLVYFLKTNIKK
jgi:glycosyltransferase involved in cell wall biosynthesis